jgi:hypothetical protein
MPDQSKNDRFKAIIAILVVLAMIGVAIYLGSKFLGINLLNKTQQLSDKGKSTVAITKKSQPEKKPPIDYEDSQDIMAQRKAELGLDKSIDMIVRPGETIRIGDSLVSIDEVLDKIRLKTGAIAEQNITDSSRDETARRQVKLPAALETLKNLDEEYREIDRQLESPSKSLDPESEQKARERQKEVSELVHTYRRYQDVLARLENAKKKLEGVNDDQVATLTKEIDALIKEKTDLENFILTRIGTDQDLDVYGIYVVKPMDNIWNIHFRFLKEYFTHKGVVLSPMADEPTPKGESSGVGRLLKFSETMVHIYNIREKKLDMDLNMIQPLSKIVVFNLARVFAMLESIDYSEVNRIRFDGETLWLPAKNE